MPHLTQFTRLFALLTCLVLGCSDNVATKDVAATVQKASEAGPAESKPVELKPGGPTSGISSTDGKQTAAAGTKSKEPAKNQPAFMKEMPGLEDPSKIEWDRETAASATIPKELPVYGNSTPVDGSSDRRFFVFQWESTDTREDIHQFYRQELKKEGWDVETRRSVGLVKAAKGKREVDVWIGGKPNEPVSILVRFKK